MNVCRRGNIHERKPHISHRVSALNPVDDASPDERYDPRQGRDAGGRRINAGFDTRAGHLAVRNADAQRKAVGTHHHACRFGPYAGNASPPRDGEGRHFSRRDCQIQPGLFIRMDAARNGPDGAVLLHALSARTVEPATGTSTVAGMPGGRRDWTMDMS